MEKSLCNEIFDNIYLSLDQILSLRSQKKIKDDGSYVTKGDLLVQNIIFNYFEDFHKNSFEIISEESLDLSIDFTEVNSVTVDPIDGTENFTSGLKEWGVSVSIYSKKKHIESGILIPELGESIISKKKLEKFESRISGLSSNLTFSDIQSLSNNYEYRITGCCVYNMLNVIKGSFKSFENQKGANSWDILAGLNLALEHELIVLVNGENYNGQFLSPDKKYSFKISNQ